MTAEYKKITVPLNLKAKSRTWDGKWDPRVDTEVAGAFKAAVRRAVQEEAKDGWLPVGRTDAESLWSADLVSTRTEKSFMSENLILESVDVYLQGPDDRRVECPSCQQQVSRFDVYCTCGFYLPTRPVDMGVVERLTQHAEEFDVAARAAAVAAGPKPPSLGAAIAGGIGAGLLGLAGGIVGELGKDARRSIEYGRLEQAIERGVRRAQ